MKRAMASSVLGLVTIALLVSCGSPASPVSVRSSQSATASTGPIQVAADREAQSTLRNAMAGAKTFFTDAGTYTGFDAARAKSIEPAVPWADGGAATTKQVVHIHVVNASDLILDVMSDSGTVFCIEDNVAGGATFGAVDATTAAGCRGTW